MPSRVFISYSHDSDTHRDRVLALADRLRNDGLESQLDQYVAHPPEGWPTWTQTQIVDADFTILVCTPTYASRFDGKETPGKGNGATWEAWILKQKLYEAGTRNHKLIPVVFEKGAATDVPLVLRPFQHYRLPNDYDDLYRHLTGQPRASAPPVGAPRSMPPVAQDAPPKEDTGGLKVIPTRGLYATLVAMTLAAGAWLWLRQPDPTPGSTRTREQHGTSADPIPASTIDSPTTPHVPKESPDQPPSRTSKDNAAATPQPTRQKPSRPRVTRAPQTVTPPPKAAEQPIPLADARRWTVLEKLTGEHFVGIRLALEGPSVTRNTVLTLQSRCEPPTTSTAGPRCLVLDIPDGLHCQLTRGSTIRIGSTLCIHPQGTKAETK